MTRSGGSVALNGFLYQILHHLDWAAGVSLTGTLDGQEVEDGCLVLEPGKGGGDAPGACIGFVCRRAIQDPGFWNLVPFGRDKRYCATSENPCPTTFPTVPDTVL